MNLTIPNSRKLVLFLSYKQCISLSSFTHQHLLDDYYFSDTERIPGKTSESKASICHQRAFNTFGKINKQKDNEVCCM